MGEYDFQPRPTTPKRSARVNFEKNPASRGKPEAVEQRRRLMEEALKLLDNFTNQRETRSYAALQAIDLETLFDQELFGETDTYREPSGGDAVLLLNLTKFLLENSNHPITVTRHKSNIEHPAPQTITVWLGKPSNESAGVVSDGMPPHARLIDWKFKQNNALRIGHIRSTDDRFQAFMELLRQRLGDRQSDTESYPVAASHHPAAYNVESESYW